MNVAGDTITDQAIAFAAFTGSKSNLLSAVDCPQKQIHEFSKKYRPKPRK